MLTLRESVGVAAILVGAATVAAVNHHPVTGRHTERERAAVQAAGDRLTHAQIAAAWTQMKLGRGAPLHEIERAFPLPSRSVHQEGAAVVLTFIGHNATCIDFVSRPDTSTVGSRHC
ncbi:MAG: hypothetical protein LC792_19465 [Actinobacteria bacterium]|nr:hypothetical protein [Actinomycetota bacterium]